jgi:CSLREA domain-containing protein
MRRLAMLAAMTVLAGLLTIGAGRPFTFGTFTVNSNADDDDGACQQPPAGDCTLREAINASNATTVTKFANQIKFAIGTGVAVIAENTSLPDVTRAATIDGTTQPGPTTTSCFSDLGHPCIELRGPASNSGVFGLTLDSSATVEGLALNGFTEGISVQAHGGVTIEDDYVGTAADGTLTGVNSGNFVGVRLRQTTVGNTVGAPGHGDLLSNNTGAAIGSQPNGSACYGSAHNVIQSNRIGTNAAGTAALPNTANGITVFDMTNFTIGGTAAGSGNQISGNAYQGVSVFEGPITGCGAVPPANVVIQGNLIGTNAAGTAAVPNGTTPNQTLDPSGILIDATGVTVGGPTSAARNVISGNSAAGVQFGSNSTGAVDGTSNTVQGNFIGTNAAGSAAVGNATGILIEGPSSLNTIGGPLQGSPGAGAGNLVSGNTTGIRVLGGSASGNVVRGNFVGTNSAGTGALPNVKGIVVDGAPSTSIDGDVLSGNLQDGLVVTGGATSTSVTGSFAGTRVDGATALPDHASGIRLDGAGSGTTVGGPSPGDGNVLSGNVQAGIAITDGTSGALAQGNMIGVDASGSTAVPNQQSGILIDDSGGNTIGGGAPGAGNVVSGNGVGFTAGPGSPSSRRRPVRPPAT